MIELVAALLLSGSAGELPRMGPDRPAFETELKFSAGGEVFRAIEARYPDDYRMLIDQIYRDAAAHPGDRAALAASGKRLLGAFYRRRAQGLANAPAPLLNAINARQLALIRRIAREDEKLCADFASSLFIGRFDLPASYQQEASALAAAIVEAAKAGETAPPDPRRKGLADDAASAWYAQLLRDEPSGGIRTAIAADGGEPTGTPEMQCRVGAAIYASIDKLAPEQAADVAAFFLAQTLTDAGAD
jgi:hypothetical protein